MRRRRARAARARPRAEEPGDGADVDSLSRPADRRAAGGRQRVLRRLPDDPRPRPRPPAASADAALAAVAAAEVGGARRCSSPSSSPTSCSICGRWPAATAWLVVGYFGAALLVDLTFTGAAFCKYVCPVGQFNFIASTLSPLEVGVRELDVCHGCTTVDCIKGAARARPTAAHGRAARLRARALPAIEGRQPRLHVLPRLRAGVPARQRRHRRPRAGRRAGGRPAPLVDRPPLEARRSRRARDGVHVRRAAQRLCDDRAGLRG